MSLGKKYVVFCGITSPRRGALEDVLDARRAEQEGAVELARVDPGGRLVEIRRVAEPLVADEPVDELDVELTRLTDDREGRATAIADRVRLGVGKTGEPLDRGGRRRRVADAAGGSASSCPRKRRWVGKISRPGSEVETSTTIIRALSGVPCSSA